ncbi:sensor histidine kinase [Corynebacterium vitaeruminis]|uniref:sensor histidine kinase n=1 Tax=Corynebacterium vitaeruminis TaxID=38305 RepID=UPI0023F9A458|nr:histidine kinase [Corynebacterium vitaeruminis]
MTTLAAMRHRLGLPTPRRLSWAELLPQFIWLTFLGFPLLTIVTLPVGQMLLGLLVLAAFVVVYATAFYHLDPALGLGWRVGVAVALLALIGAEWAISGVDALSMLLYVDAWVFFTFLGATRVFTLIATITVLYVLTPSGQRAGFIVGATILYFFVLGSRTAREERARREELASQLAIINERERVARDVHDALGHSLTAIIIKSQVAARMVEAAPERAAAELKEITDIARGSLAEIRETVSGLRASDPGSELASAASALESAGIDATLPTPEEVERIEVSRRILLAWVIRELATNVLRHSKATRCWIELSPNGLTVSDDGVGIPGAQPSGDESDVVLGNGLRGIRERLADFGAAMRVSTCQHPLPDAPGQPRTPGTTVEVSFT